MVIPKRLVALGGLLALLACSDATGSGGDLAPVWITASWTGGAAGAPNDRVNREPKPFKGQLCPAVSVGLTNQTEGAVLNVINNCTIPITLAICVSAGGLTQPTNGLQDCAPDPFDTPLSRFKIIPLLPGNLGDYVNATPILSIQIFYCSDETQFATQPVRCVG